jgi:quinol monooxygenase YgiN
MINFSLRVKVPNSRVNDVKALFDSYIEPISVQPGCLKIDIFNTLNHAEEFFLIEEWNSYVNLQRHIVSDDFRKLLAIMDLAMEQPELSFQHVSSIQGFELVEKLRKKFDQGLIQKSKM